MKDADSVTEKLDIGIRHRSVIVADNTKTSSITQPRALSILDAAKYIGVGRGLIYKLAARGELPLRKIGDRSIVLREDLDRFLDGLPAVHGDGEAA